MFTYHHIRTLLRKTESYVRSRTIIKKDKGVVMTQFPFYYQVMEIFQKKASDLGFTSSIIDGELYSYPQYCDALFDRPWIERFPVNPSIITDESNTPPPFGFDDFYIYLKEFEGIQYLCMDHFNEMISGAYFKGIATNKGNLHKLILRCRKFKKALPEPPILHPEDYDATIGTILKFLKNRKKIKKMGVTVNKGFLLFGAPGNGKTLISSYIKDICDHYGYKVNIVDMKKIAAGQLSGDVLIMDDFSIEPLIKRGEITDILLSEMDGPNKEGGRVYIITTNELEEKHKLEEALIRPGRIDTQIRIKMPDAQLRLKYISSWKLNLNKEICEDITNRTNHWSFAALNKLQTELVMQHIDNKPLDINTAIKACGIKIKDSIKERPKVGFGSVEYTDLGEF